MDQKHKWYKSKSKLHKLYWTFFGTELKLIDLHVLMVDLFEQKYDNQWIKTITYEDSTKT